MRDPLAGPTTYVDCRCGLRQQRRRERILAAAFHGALERYRGHTLDSWLAKVTAHDPTKTPRAAAICSLLSLWVEEPRPGAGLMLIGERGTGKSALAAIVLRERIERDLVESLYVTTPDLLAAIRATYGPHGEGSEPQVIDAVTTVPLLVLDDLGAERPSEWVEEQLFRVINHRYNALATTIVTSNLGRVALARRIGERIVDRLGDMARTIYLDTPDLRKKGED